MDGNEPARDTRISTNASAIAAAFQSAGDWRRTSTFAQPCKCRRKRCSQSASDMSGIFSISTEKARMYSRIDLVGQSFRTASLACSTELPGRNCRRNSSLKVSHVIIVTPDDDPALVLHQS